MKNAWVPGTEPAYLFHQGTNFRAYEFLGCHINYESAVFRVWAPNAEGVSVCGDWNGWNPDANPMVRITNGGVWETYVDGVSIGQRYKYFIRTENGSYIEKADPYAFFSETNGKTASIVYDIDGYEWQDSEWQRTKSAPYDKPMNIYECHPGSWRFNAEREPYGYRDAANELIPYLLDMGYNYLELLPVMEHPYGKSWGYQTTGYFAPTSRWGEPKDLMYLVDKCHQAGIGVILDWVPSHFPKDAHGLSEFDGEPLYEAHGSDRQEQPQWGTRCFDYGRTEVQSFLVSSALYWFEMFHADGLRVDAVSSMLYLDFGRESGQWTPNTYGNNMNLEAIAFIKKLNTAVFEHYPNAIMTAEESTAYPMVTKPIDKGGLGFNFKWNMGWMNDVLDYWTTDPLFRKYKHDKICFSFQYAYTENFILPISHDEVVHGKLSLLNKMPGEYEQKFAGLRAFLGYMFTHPGKKLNFMGSEFGQFIEWNEEDSLDWHLLEYPAHKMLHCYVRELNTFYLDNPELWELDFDSRGFNWISGEDREQNILLYERIAKSGDKLIVLHNFAPVTRHGYRVGVDIGEYSEVFNSDLAKYGGRHIRNDALILSEPLSCHGRENSISLTLPGMSTLVLKAVQ